MERHGTPGASLPGHRPHAARRRTAVPVAPGIIAGMDSGGQASAGWTLSDDPDQVHALLCASDEYAADVYRLPRPRRNRDTTDRLVRDGCVHALHEGGELIAMFTLTPQPPYPLDETGFPDRSRPRYLQRLAVSPDRLRAGSLLGVQSVARALEVAAAAGSDAVRSEANPDLRAVVDMLRALGFVPYARPTSDAPLRRVYLQRDLPRDGAA